MDSILLTIRTMLGIPDGFDGFDVPILSGINSAIFSLSQLGVGPDGGLVVTDDSQTWTELYDGVTNLESVKAYVWLKTRLIFDPPGTSFLLTAIQNQVVELEWRLQTEVDPDFVPAE
jgi:hypothetical protein